MVRWWPDAFPDQPYGVWFYAKRPNETSTNPCEWPTGYYWFFKIEAEGGHRDQLMFYSEVNKYYKSCWSNPKNIQFYANVKYLLCYPDDTPNWAGCDLVQITPPCRNWRSDLYMETESTRSQTYGIQAAVRSDRDLQTGIVSAVAKNGQLGDEILAAIQGQPELLVTLKAAICGDAEKEPRIRAAIRKERDLQTGIVSAVAKTDQLEDNIKVAIRGNPHLDIRTRAAIKGEAQASVTIVAYIQVKRVDRIKLEMENLVPQELDIRSVPNWSSQVKDWRKESLG